MNLLASNYAKSVTTIDEQINTLKTRNVIISDENKAREILTRVSYFRLATYIWVLKKNKNSDRGPVLFETAYEVYEFDKQLRKIVLHVLENIEIAFRNHIVHQLNNKYGPFGYLESKNFQNKSYHSYMVQKITDEQNRSDTQFVKYYVKKYNQELPIWVAIELTSFGLLSKIFSNMKNEDKKDIATNYYGIPYIYLDSWLYVFSTVRNICAHFERLYSRTLTIRPSLDNKDRKKGIDNGTLFAVIFVMSKVSLNQKEWERFVEDLRTLIDRYQQSIEIKNLGFLDHWESFLT